MMRQRNFTGGFCGDSFWGIMQPVPSSLPFPSECFSHTVLVAVPTLFLCAVLPVLYIQIKTSRAKQLPWTMLQSMKWLVTALMVGDKLVLLFFSVWRTLLGPGADPTVNIVYPIFQSISLILVLMLMDSCRRAGLSNPGAIFCIWLVFLICGAPEFYAWITLGSDPSVVGQIDFVQYVCYLAYYPLLLLEFVLNCFSDPSTLCNNEHFESTKTHPETSASFPNRQFLWWFGPMVSKAYKRPLEIDDLFDLDDGLKSDTLMAQWEKEWDKTMKGYEKRRQAQSLSLSDNYFTEKSPLLFDDGKNYGTQKKARDPGDEVELPSIIGVLWRLFKWELIGGSAVKFFSDIIQFANPAFLSLLISFTEDPNAPLYQGLFYSAGLFISAVLRSLFFNNYFTIMFRVGTKIQSTLTAAVYNKVLICMFLLWQTVGYAVIAGLLVMVSVIPFNICISLISKRWTVQQMRLKDERIRITNEILSGIKVVKLYAWEPAMEDVVDKIRVQEMSLVALTTFATYTLTAPDHVLTPQIAFVSLTLFNQLRGPLLMAADLISQTVQARLFQLNIMHNPLKTYPGCCVE
ncbi:hypothetical protein GCK32_007181 [Trichostrongylus colubriformis]|uniref:ABC transmembrane type-1 domain-containing protein n=1 Tax=Trichostrongylus colubriformis TaxID=6319 RepID=A0AAN8IRK9_TRICO